MCLNIHNEIYYFDYHRITYLKNKLREIKIYIFGLVLCGYLNKIVINKLYSRFHTFIRN